MKRVVLIVLALFVLAPSIAHATTLFQCATDGEVRTACCCPAAAKHHDDSPVPNVRATCCCKITHSMVREASPKSPPPAAYDVAAFSIAPIAVVTMLVVASVQAVRIEYVSAPRGPPESLFARRVSMLI